MVSDERSGDRGLRIGAVVGTAGQILVLLAVAYACERVALSLVVSQPSGGSQATQSAIAGTV